jgi:hypothetical protein
LLVAFIRHHVIAHTSALCTHKCPIWTVADAPDVDLATAHKADIACHMTAELSPSAIRRRARSGKSGAARVVVPRHIQAAEGDRLLLVADKVVVADYHHDRDQHRGGAASA